MILVDTNILVHAANPPDPLHPVAKGALAKFRQRGEILCIAPQNLVEFWSVVTRPASNRNGLGIDVASAEKEIETVKSPFSLASLYMASAENMAKPRRYAWRFRQADS